MSTPDKSANWDSVELGDMITLHRGYDLPSGQRRNGAIPVVSSSGITGYHNEPKIQPPGVVTGRYGTLGEVFFVEEPFWPLNTTLYVSDFHGNNERFINYFLQCQGLRTRDAASAVPGINRNVLHRLPARRPPISAQRKIAAVLSAYDDLIENNHRRIKLLEEMAQRIYREWFADFRYPGHENVLLVDSEVGPIPHGWEILAIQDVGRLVTGSTPPSGAPEWWGSEVAFVTPTDLSYGRIWVEPKRRLSALGAQKLASRLLPTGAVCFTCIGATIGKICITQEPSITNQQINSVVPAKDRVNPAFLFHKLTTDADRIRGTAGGAATPIISKSSFGAIRLGWPPLDIQNLFGWHVHDCHELVASLERQNEVLRSSLDLLLPLLVSGEIDVAHLDLAMPEARS